jgi:hypothetical protein
MPALLFRLKKFNQRSNMLDIAIDRATTAWLGVHRRMHWSFEDPDKWIVTEGKNWSNFEKYEI